MTQTASQQSTDYRARVAAMYDYYAPEKVSAGIVDAAMKTYEGREEKFLAALRKKYGPEPKGFLDAIPDAPRMTSDDGHMVTAKSAGDWAVPTPPSGASSDSLSSGNELRSQMSGSQPVPQRKSSLTALAAAHGVSLDALARANPHIEDTKSPLPVGTKLSMPTGPNGTPLSGAPSVRFPSAPSSESDKVQSRRDGAVAKSEKQPQTGCFGSCLPKSAESGRESPARTVSVKSTSEDLSKDRMEQTMAAVSIPRLTDERSTPALSSAKTAVDATVIQELDEIDQNLSVADFPRDCESSLSMLSASTQKRQQSSAPSTPRQASPASTIRATSVQEALPPVPQPTVRPTSPSLSRGTAQGLQRARSPASLTAVSEVTASAPSLSDGPRTPRQDTPQAALEDTASRRQSVVTSSTVSTAPTHRASTVSAPRGVFSAPGHRTGSEDPAVSRADDAEAYLVSTSTIPTRHLHSESRGSLLTTRGASARPLLPPQASREAGSRGSLTGLVDSMKASPQATALSRWSQHRSGCRTDSMPSGPPMPRAAVPAAAAPVPVAGTQRLLAFPVERRRRSRLLESTNESKSRRGSKTASGDVPSPGQEGKEQKSGCGSFFSCGQKTAARAQSATPRRPVVPLAPASWDVVPKIEVQSTSSSASRHAKDEIYSARATSAGRHRVADTRGDRPPLASPMGQTPQRARAQSATRGSVTAWSAVSTESQVSDWLVSAGAARAPSSRPAPRGRA